MSRATFALAISFLVQWTVERCLVSCGCGPSFQTSLRGLLFICLEINDAHMAEVDDCKFHVYIEPKYALRVSKTKSRRSIRSRQCCMLADSGETTLLISMEHRFWEGKSDGQRDGCRRASLHVTKTPFLREINTCKLNAARKVVSSHAVVGGR